MTFFMRDLKKKVQSSWNCFYLDKEKREIWDLADVLEYLKVNAVDTS